MYQIIWKFEPRKGKQSRFEKAYAADGAWCRLFQRSEGYLGTQLLPEPHPEGQRVYVTIDTWRSESDYASFKDRWRSEYDALDRSLGHLTASETLVGTFECMQAGLGCPSD